MKDIWNECINLHQNVFKHVKRVLSQSRICCSLYVTFSSTLGPTNVVKVVQLNVQSGQTIGMHNVKVYQIYQICQIYHHCSLILDVIASADNEPDWTRFEPLFKINNSDVLGHYWGEKSGWNDRKVHQWGQIMWNHCINPKPLNLPHLTISNVNINAILIFFPYHIRYMLNENIHWTKIKLAKVTKLVKSGQFKGLINTSVSVICHS